MKTVIAVAALVTVVQRWNKLKEIRQKFIVIFIVCSLFHYRQGSEGEGLNTFSLWGRRGREANQVNMDKT